MTNDDLIQYWASRFGLAQTPMFEYEKVVEGLHSVLLDGGHGSFALSVSSEEIWRENQTANWAWSSNLPHHVTVTNKAVAVTRWDRRQVEVLSRASVEARIESFYSYLTADRVRSTSAVVDHVIGLFRRVRSLVATANLPDDRSVDAFLALLTVLMERDSDKTGKFAERNNIILPELGENLLKSLPQNGVESLLRNFQDRGSTDSLRLLPSLAIRHAGSEIFQEAHFELLRTPGMDLFGIPGPAETRPITRGGTHFTPAPLARSVVEQTLRQVENLSSRNRLVILDPACGSGAFLQESVRTLRRMNFDGEVILLGRDISSAAISMANFVVRHTAMDWAPKQPIHIDLRVGDSLVDDLPQSDVILMNPPFVAWPALDKHQREKVRQILDKQLQGRADLSMAFVSRSIDLLSPGGALGVLLPSSLLTLQAAEPWREDLLNRTDLRLLASIGDYGLFAHAQIQVAAAVFAKPTSADNHSELTTALVTNNSAESTGNALRRLRRTDTTSHSEGEDRSWQIFDVPISQFRSRPTWRLNSPRIETALAVLLDSGALRIEELFDVRQGIRTGDNKSFVLDVQALQALPPKERRFFKSALMNDSIQDGKLSNLFSVFYPYDEKGALFATEEELLSAVPRYASRYLLAERNKLASRSSMTRANRSDWWALSWERLSWSFNPAPRIVSKYFGGPGGFAVDLNANFVIVQGFGWFLKAKPDSEDDASVDENDLLFAYAALMNSRPFGRVLELFSSHVAGGQFDLSPRYVNQILIPNLSDLYRDERTGRLISKLSTLGREPRLLDADWRNSADRITTELYGFDFLEQV